MNTPTFRVVTLLLAVADAVTLLDDADVGGVDAEDSEVVVARGELLVVGEPLVVPACDGLPALEWLEEHPLTSSAPARQQIRETFDRTVYRDVM